MLDSKRVLVTGAGQGIGRAIAMEAGKQGAESVVVADVNEATGNETAQLIRDGGTAASFVRVDLREARQIEQMVNAATAFAGGLDVLINNAGVIESNFTADSAVDRLREDVWDAVLDINLKATWLAIKFAAPHLRSSRRGPAIVNAASVTGLTGYPIGPAYCASKGGVVQLTKAAAVDLAPAVRCNCFCPGSVDSPMRHRFIEAAEDKEAAERFMVASHLIPRAGRTEEVAKLACFLASDDASFITGGVYVIDGGSLAWRGVRES
jgi:NAD(P)-dependent dehydrogenase (short-subunit alcohol dehydrogenase family)